MSAVLLSCRNLSKSFTHALIPVRHIQERMIAVPRARKEWHVRAVDNVSLAVSEGEWVGIYGPNGCGKTTLLRMCAGLMVPDEGTVHCTDDLSCFFELSIGFHDERTAEENVRMHALLQGAPRRRWMHIIDEARSFADIGEHWDLPLKCYSTGMRLRLGFAVTTALPGKLLLLDEILAVGDAAFQDRCKKRLHQMRSRGHAAVMVSHSLGDLKGYCDRVLHMENGHILREEAGISIRR